MYIGQSKVARIAERQTDAEYVHYASHNLNTATSDCAGNISEINNFYAVVKLLYYFFGSRIKR